MYGKHDLSTFNFMEYCTLTHVIILRNLCNLLALSVDWISCDDSLTIGIVFANFSEVDCHQEFTILGHLVHYLTHRVIQGLNVNRDCD